VFHATPKVVADDPPSGDARYDQLVADLHWAQEYGYYIRTSLRDSPGTNPEGVDAWRRRVTRPTVLNGRVTRQIEVEESSEGGFSFSDPHNEDHQNDDNDRNDQDQNGLGGNQVPTTSA